MKTIQHTAETCPGRPCGSECDHVEFIEDFTDKMTYEAIISSMKDIEFFLDALMDDPNHWSAAKEQKHKAQAIIREMEIRIDMDIKIHAAREMKALGNNWVVLFQGFDTFPKLDPDYFRGAQDVRSFFKDKHNRSLKTAVVYTIDEWIYKLESGDVR